MESKKFFSFLQFLGDFLGDDIEIVVSDIKNRQIEFIHNAFNTDKQVGGELPEIEKNIIERNLFKGKKSISNYRAFSTNKDKLRSSSFFEKDSSEDLVRIITINYKVDKLITFRENLDQLINGPNNVHYEEENFQESFNHSFIDLMDEIIQNTISQLKVPPERLSHSEKLELVKSLDNKGVFLIKGSVAELANILRTSETSVYRYINNINKV